MVWYVLAYCILYTSLTEKHAESYKTQNTVIIIMQHLTLTPLSFLAAIRAKMKIGELSRRIESRSATPYSVPSKHLITSKPAPAPPVVFSKPYSIPSYLKVGNVCEIDPVLGI